jgi:hypothetical protein
MFAHHYFNRITWGEVPKDERDKSNADDDEHQPNQSFDKELKHVVL